MVSSGLVIIADNAGNTNGLELSRTSLEPATLYNLTFVARGLTDLFTGSNSWFVFVYNNTGGFPINTTSVSGSIMVPAGTYYYQANDYFQDLYSSDYSPTVTVNSNTTVYLNFSQPQTIMFNETGLNPGYIWGVSMSGSNPVYTHSSTVSGGSSVKYYAVNGHYSYSWVENQGGINTTLGSSNFYVQQTNLTFSLPISTFSNVTFNENNLPQGTTWFIRQVSGPDANDSYEQGSGSTIVMRTMEGINTFVAGYVINGFNISIASVTVNVGQEVDVTVDFPILYSVSINATNLPEYTTYSEWGFNGSFSYGPFINYFEEAVPGPQSMTVLLPVSSMAEEPFIELNNNAGGTSPSYVVQFPQSSIHVTQSGQTQSIHLGRLYTVKLNFPNMPAGYYLTVNSNIGYIQSYTSSQGDSSATLLAPNGTYDFTYGMADTSSGAGSMSIPFSFIISGSNSTVNVDVYNITFTSSYTQSSFYLYLGSPESSEVGYFQGSGSAGQNLSIYLSNGSYAYQLYSSYGGLSNSAEIEASGQFTVLGHSGTMLVQIPETYFNTTFVALGLPQNAPYFTYVSSVDQNVSVSGEFYLTSGSYDYAYLPQGEYYATHVSSEYDSSTYYANNTYFNVTSSGTVQLNFSTNAYFKFTEEGLPAGAEWNITFDGTPHSSTGKTIVVSGNSMLSLPFHVGRIGNYAPNPSSGSILADNQYYLNNFSMNYNIPVQFTPETLSGNAGISISTINATTLSTGSGSQFNLSGENTIDMVTSDPANGLTYIFYTPDSYQVISYIAVVNSSNYAPVAKIAVGSGAVQVYAMLDQANGILYSIMRLDYNQGFYYIASLNTANNRIQLTPINISGLSSLVLDKGSGMIYAAGYYGVYELNPETLGIISTIFMNGTYAEYAGGQGLNLFYSTGTGMIYATGYIPNGIVTIDPSDNSISGNFTFRISVNRQDAYVGGSSIDQKGMMIYFTLQQYNVTTGSYPSNIIEFNITTQRFQVGPSIGQGWAGSIAYDAANNYIYIPVQMEYAYSSTLSSLDLGQLDIFEPSSGLLVNYTELGQNPDGISLDPANSNILIGNSYMGSVTVIGTASLGFIQGTVNTHSASVTINGITVPVMNGQFAASVQPGTYYVGAFASGYSPEEQDVRVTDFSTSIIALNLSTTRTYLVTGTVSPSGASVLFNGIAASVSTTGNYRIDIAPGNYTVSAYLAGYYPLSEKVGIGDNMSLNLTLSKEPSPESEMINGNFIVYGFNVTVSALDNYPNSTFAVQFNSSADGILLVEVPYADLNSVNLSDLLSSRVYINNKEYNNFSVILSSNYTVILKVSGLSNDPTLLWLYGPEAVPPKLPANSSVTFYYYVAGAIVAIAVIGAAVIILRGRSRKK